jgi:hypothetical protein
VFKCLGNADLLIGIDLALSRILRNGVPLTNENVASSYANTLVPAFSAAASNAAFPGPLPKNGFYFLSLIRFFSPCFVTVFSSF